MYRTLSFSTQSLDAETLEQNFSVLLTKASFGIDPGPIMVSHVLTGATIQKSQRGAKVTPTSLELSRKKANCCFRWSVLARSSACLEK